MKSLLTYEFKKNFQKMKWPTLILIVLTVFFLLIVSGGIDLVVMFSFMGLILVIFFSLIAPMVATIISYNKDLNNPHAVFETYIPQNGWKRLGSKYISYFAQIQAGVLFSALTLWLFSSIIYRVIPTDIKFEMTDRIQGILNYINVNSGGLLWVFARLLLSAGLGMLSVTLFFNFFITLHSVLRHRIKAATPLTFLAGAITSISLGWISDQLFNKAGRMQEAMVASGPEILFNFIIAAIAFYAMGWMLEYKTELK